MALTAASLPLDDIHPDHPIPLTGDQSPLPKQAQDLRDTHPGKACQFRHIAVGQADLFDGQKNASLRCPAKTHSQPMHERKHALIDRSNSGQLHQPPHLLHLQGQKRLLFNRASPILLCHHI